MNRDSAFFKRSSHIAARFLHTAVVIDDRAFNSEPDEQFSIPLIPPPTPSTVGPAVISVQPSLALPPDTTVLAAPDAHGLDAQAVIDGFARKGIVCSVLKRRPDDVLTNPASRLSRLADAADILVIDWNIHVGNHESAEETLELLEKAIRKNIDETPRQLRLIAVYTGELNLNSVAEKIRDRLRERVGEVASEGEFTFVKGSVRIVILAKKITSTRSLDAQKQVADFGDLAERTIAEFTEMTAGIVSNFALDALARLRKATSSILNRFNPSLDSAFLLHRCLMLPPEEADEHLPPIIASELQALIEDGAPPLTEEIISEWFDQRAETLSKSGFQSEAEERKFLIQLCSGGYKNALEGKTMPQQLEWIKNIAPGYGHDALNQLLDLIAASENKHSNEDLAMLMAVKARYSVEPPYLTLGTIVAHPKDGKSVYWLCLQPSCDSVRIDGTRGFPMLRLVESNTLFGLVVRNGNDFVKLRIDPRPFKVRTIEFKSHKTKKCILSERNTAGEFWFKSKDAEFQCKWIAELKFEQAQRAVQKLAAQNSRVGLTESEWQRRWDLSNPSA